MPTYVYHCTTCDKTFEAFHRMSDKPLTTCGCGASGTVERQLSAGSGVIFKGTGFYQTDYKGGNASSGASSNSKTESKSSESSAPSGGTCGSGGCADCS
ncbi:MAG: zinc ribbon domain-containing protein [Candidatus Sumerlaeia bacterium]|nr:zinc ribbon domain-containing protein [Candidatus Sumerlaeia bacterium]